MKNNHATLFLQLLGLLTCVLLITFYINHKQKGPVNPAILSGKWQLLRIDDPYKIILPPTDVIKLELEFDEKSFAQHTTGKGKGVKGNVLSGNFTGTVTFDAKEMEGELHMGSMQITKDALLKSYKQFDEYYLQQLARAKKFAIQQRRLIITSEDAAELIYTRVGRN